MDRSLRPLTLACGLALGLMLTGPLLADAKAAEPTSDTDGYGGFAWGESEASVRKQLKAARPRAELDTEGLSFERTVLKLEVRDRQFEARKAAKKGAKARQEAPIKARLSALSYWVKLDALDGRVLLHFFDGRLYGADLDLPFEAAFAEDALLLLKLIEGKYGTPKSHRGAETKGAAVLDVFETREVKLEVFHQPPSRGHGGFVNLLYRSRDVGPQVFKYMTELRERRDTVDSKRRAFVPTQKDREADRAARLLKNL